MIRYAAAMTVLDELYEGWTSDSPGNPRFPLYTHAPTGDGAAAAGSPFVNGITYRGRDQIVTRFWCADRPTGPVLRVDFEPLVETYPWRGGPVRASAPFAAAMIVGAFFEAHCDGWYRREGVRSIVFRDLRDGSLLTVDHARPFDEDRDLVPHIAR